MQDISGKRQPPPNRAVREVDTMADSAQSVDSRFIHTPNGHSLPRTRVPARTKSNVNIVDYLKKWKTCPHSSNVALYAEMAPLTTTRVQSVFEHARNDSQSCDQSNRIAHG